MRVDCRTSLDHTRDGESVRVEYSGELHAHMISLGLQAVANASDSVGSDSRIGRNIEDI